MTKEKNMRNKIRELAKENLGMPLSDEMIDIIISKIPDIESYNDFDLTSMVFAVYEVYLLDSFKEFAVNLNEDDIDWDNKLDNLSDELTLEDYEKLNRPSFDRSSIYQYIKKHIKKYTADIVSNTILINQQVGSYENNYENDLASGLYNCDILYLKAIGKVLHNNARYYM